MFDRTPASSEAHALPEHTPGGPDHLDPGFSPPPPDPAGLLAAVGLTSQAIHEILGNTPHAVADA